MANDPTENFQVPINNVHKCYFQVSTTITLKLKLVSGQSLNRCPYEKLMDKDPLHLEISPFVHFMVKILFHKSNDI
jgi:hypothetical protein